MNPSTTNVTGSRQSGSHNQTTSGILPVARFTPVALLFVALNGFAKGKLIALAFADAYVPMSY
jgi:hypothetical protein